MDVYKTERDRLYETVQRFTDVYRNVDDGGDVLDELANLYHKASMQLATMEPPEQLFQITQQMTLRVHTHEEALFNWLSCLESEGTEWPVVILSASGEEREYRVEFGCVSIKAKREVEELNDE